MESEKRYKASTRGYIVDRTNADVMDTHEAADRLNALEAERDALREALRKSFLALGGVAPADVPSEFLCTVPEEVTLKVQAIEAERDRLREALERIELMDPDWTLGVDENMSRLQSIAGRALEGGGDEAV